MAHDAAPVEAEGQAVRPEIARAGEAEAHDHTGRRAEIRPDPPLGKTDEAPRHRKDAAAGRLEWKPGRIRWAAAGSGPGKAMSASPITRGPSAFSILTSSSA
jgi:hypothetical protein